MKEETKIPEAVERQVEEIARQVAELGAFEDETEIEDRAEIVALLTEHWLRGKARGLSENEALVWARKRFGDPKDVAKMYKGRTGDTLSFLFSGSQRAARLIAVVLSGGSFLAMLFMFGLYGKSWMTAGVRVGFGALLVVYLWTAFFAARKGNEASGWRWFVYQSSVLVGMFVMWVIMCVGWFLSVGVFLREAATRDAVENVCRLGVLIVGAYCLIALFQIGKGMGLHLWWWRPRFGV